MYLFLYKIVNLLYLFSSSQKCPNRCIFACHINSCHRINYPPPPSPTPCTAYFTCKQILPFGFAVQYRPNRGLDDSPCKCGTCSGPVLSYKLRYIVGFGLVEMAISTNPKPTIYRNLYENMGPGGSDTVSELSLSYEGELQRSFRNDSQWTLAMRRRYFINFQWLI